MMDFIAQYGAWGLFVSAFIAGTVVPFSSEVVIVAVIAMGVDPWVALLAAATGNILGGMTTYFMGYFLELKKVLRYFKVKQEKIDRMYPYAHKYGFILGLLGFVPLMGNVVMITLGSLRSSWIGTLMTTSVGRTLRYYLIVFVQMQISK
ncbi:MAG: DedA family protein [Flavobacteriales bacterium]|nr:DedA family protein [Flavobacteriales bacterium]